MSAGISREAPSHPSLSVTDDPPPGPGAPSRPVGLHPVLRLLLFPAVIVSVAAVLGGLELTGSSAALYAQKGQHDGLVLGRDRFVRQDEWFVRTPLLARQAAIGFPRHDQMGVGEHDMTLLNDLPTRGWEALLKPQLLPYHVFGFEHAFALEWWVDFLVLPALGVYALALVLGIRTLTAALISLIVVLSPAVVWWTVSWTGTSIGYASLAGATLIVATRARSVYLRIGFAAVAGCLGACLVAVLYPPWVIPMTLGIGAATLAAIVVTLPAHRPRRMWWLRLGVVGVAASAGGVLVLAFVLAHRAGLDAISNSIYPGRRRSAGGTGDFFVLLGAPFDVIEATRSSSGVSVNGLNQSEAAAGLFTVFAIVAALLTDGPRSFWRPWRNRLALLAVLGAGLVPLAWYLLPVPAAVGRLLLFDHVRSDRMLLPIAVLGALALGLFVDVYLGPGRRLSRRALIAGTAAFALPTLWAGWRLRIDGELASRWLVVLLAVAVTVGVGLALSGRRAGLVVVVALFAVGAATVNPLQRGLAELVDGPAAQLGRELAARPDTGVVAILFEDPRGDLKAQGGLTASGVPLVSGVNQYPNAAAWRVLDPNEASRHAWDRYNIAAWTAGPPGSKPHIRLIPPAALTITVDPCDPRLAKLGIRTIVTDLPLTRSCLTEIDRTKKGRILYAYRIEPSSR